MSNITVTMDRMLRSNLVSQGALNLQTITGEAKVTEIQHSCHLLGVWATKKRESGSARKNVTVMGKNGNHISNMAAPRRSHTSAKANRKNMKNKQIDEGQYARLCNVETPEGEMCGNARFLAVGSTITTPSSKKVLLSILKDWLVPGVDWCDVMQNYDQPSHLAKFPYILDVDGHMIWRCRSGTQIVTLIRKLRRRGLISPYVGCGMDNQMILVRVAPGHITRPLIILKNWIPYLMQPRLQSEGQWIFNMSLATALSRGLVYVWKYKP
jgi:DNA-directed RNA polymerase beta subunit